MLPRYATDRLNPTLMDLDYLILRSLRRCISKYASHVRGKVLDFGCGDIPYRPLFRQCSHYLGADVAGNPKAVVTYEIGQSLPLGDETMDAVVSFQVLEHVQDPAHYLSECRRIVRPGGCLVLTTHGIWPYHPGPLDCCRWTHEGLALEIQRAGFEVQNVEAICTSWTCLIQMAQVTMIRRFFERRLSYPLGYVGCVLLNWIGRLVEGRQTAVAPRDRRSEVAICYLVHASRPV